MTVTIVAECNPTVTWVVLTVDVEISDARGIDRSFVVGVFDERGVEQVINHLNTQYMTRRISFRQTKVRLNEIMNTPQKWESEISNREVV